MKPSRRSHLTEDQLVRRYFAPKPANSFLMKLHMQWHMNPDNSIGVGNFGARFLEFHKSYIDLFDLYRKAKGYRPMRAWDPATRIPKSLFHRGRNKPGPGGIYPGCATPTWATIAGGPTPAPINLDCYKLADFQSLDDLGNNIAFAWHPAVHAAIGGDMAGLTAMAPLDPVFFAFHKWIDKIRQDWLDLQN